MAQLMTNETARIYPHDRFFNAVLIRFLPHQLHPNHVTLFRFFLIPFVVWYVLIEQWSVAVPLFLFAAFTDALDGSMARLRKQITVWGTFADPAADKLLIGSVVVIFVAKEVNPIFATVIVFVEVCILLTGLIRGRKRLVVSANWAGKMKMLFQVIGVTALLLAKWLGLSLLVPISIGTLTVAIVFAVVSLLTYSL
ncbi:CDP-alcohol phosphatidyltransferase family protein [Candidatus Uhrbacteria bacterium]|nr:CDP-alcohol phosphatidyltransferase family protein [Candidatus Uhrbacteria bacterium]